MKQWQAFEPRQAEALSDGNFICEAAATGLILVNGDDARDFLQNQLSNDITQIDETHFQISSYSTPKGRMLGVFRVVQISNGYLLVTNRSIVQPLLEKLYHYIVRSQVTLADATDYFARILIQTDDPKVIEHPLLPEQVSSSIQNDSVVSLKLESVAGQCRYLLLCLSADEAITLWDDFAEKLSISGDKSWQLSEIKAGIPSIAPGTSEEFVLQMANLNELNGVSFKKGCYPGQEIVARMQYLGKLKRRMFLAELETDQLPLPGDDLVSSGKQIADGSGKFVDAQFDENGLCHCLYIAQINKAEAGNLEWLGHPEITINNSNLPYPLKK
ncbi:MAG: hypothetical protein AAF353_15495 [Pseudomonadota bacterium]